MIPIIKPTQSVEVNKLQMACFAVFANRLSPLGLGITCAKCGQALEGVNSDTDKVFSVKCGCREFLCANPHVRQVPTDPQFPVG